MVILINYRENLGEYYRCSFGFWERQKKVGIIGETEREKRMRVKREFSECKIERRYGFHPQERPG